MTEQEYLNVTNRVLLQASLKMLSEITFVDDNDANVIKGIRKTLTGMDQQLLSVIDQGDCVITPRERLLMKAAMKVSADYTPDEVDSWLGETVNDSGDNIEYLLDSEINNQLE